MGTTIMASGMAMTGAPRPHEAMRARPLPLLSTRFQPQLLVARRTATILARRSEVPLAILFIDLDRFEAINDACGHEVGDKVPQSVAPAVMDQMRGSDLLVRWGGEEFVAVLPNLRCEVAGAFLMRLRAAGMGLRPDGAPVTASVGMSERQADAVDDWARLVEIADRRMYQAKRAGRDCCVGCGDAPLYPPANLTYAAQPRG